MLEPRHSNSDQPESARYSRIIGTKRVHAAGFAVLRTPLLPLDDFVAWGADLTAIDAIPAHRNVDERLCTALADDRRRLRSRLLEIISDPVIREALYLGSPDLVHGLQDWLADPENPKWDSIELAIARYFSRMSCRATPFGLFAGCSYASVAPHTELKLSARSTYQRSTRLDMDYICDLVDTVSANEAIQADLRFFPNNSLYSIGDRLRYVESRVDGNGRSHHLVSIEPDRYVFSALERAASGANPTEIASALTTEDPDLDRGSALKFVSELIDSQLLVPEISVPVTGSDALSMLVEKLQNITPAADIVALLRSTKLTLDDFDRHGTGVEPDKYATLARTLGSLPVPIDLKRLVQVDMWKPTDQATISPRLITMILNGVELLHSLAPHPPSNPLDDFIEDFRERYGESEQPLAEVLDEETGIGFMRSSAPGAEDCPLLDGLPLRGATSAPKVAWQPIHSLLQKHLSEALAQGSQEIVIEESEFADVATQDARPLPDAFAVMATIASGGSSGEDLDKNALIHIRLVTGPSGAKILGRFCTLDSELETQVRQHLAREESHRPDAVFAEIAHLPEGRIGNVIYRPTLREYEIPYLGWSTVEKDHQIPLSDLMVSIRGRRIILRSLRLQREVIPRMTNAHNYTRLSIGVYQFLCMLQGHQRERGLQLSWGPLENSPFLPRVRCGNIVYSLATWRIGPNEIKKLYVDDVNAGFLAVQEWRHQLHLPRIINVVEADNTLPIDLDNALSVEVFRNHIRSRHSIEICEMFPDIGTTPVHGPEGRFRNELVIPFDTAKQPRTGTKPNAAPPRKRFATIKAAMVADSIHLKRRLAPGSEWLFFKIYCGTATADRVLREAIAPVVSQLLLGGTVDKWFFIRYRDPHWHLRLRFHGDSQRLVSEVIPLVHEVTDPWIRKGLVHSLKLDTYERELDRYGGHASIEAVESLFAADSDAVLAIISRLTGDRVAELRWALGILGVDRIFRDFGFDTAEKLSATEPLRKGYFQEFNGGKHLKKGLGRKYRQKRPLLSGVLSGDINTWLGEGGNRFAAALQDDLSPGDLALIGAAQDIMEERGRHWCSAIQRLHDDDRAGRLTEPLPAILGSLAHMHMNRILRSSARAQELVAYEFLCREYTSTLARCQGKRKQEGQAV